MIGQCDALQFVPDWHQPMEQKWIFGPALGHPYILIVLEGK
jgi:hypothetical protein